MDYNNRFIENAVNEVNEKIAQLGRKPSNKEIEDIIIKQQSDNDHPQDVAYKIQVTVNQLDRLQDFRSQTDRRIQTTPIDTFRVRTKVQSHILKQSKQSSVKKQSSAVKPKIEFVGNPVKKTVKQSSASVAWDDVVNLRPDKLKSKVINDWANKECSLTQSEIQDLDAIVEMKKASSEKNTQKAIEDASFKMQTEKSQLGQEMDTLSYRLSLKIKDNEQKFKKIQSSILYFQKDSLGGTIDAIKYCQGLDNSKEQAEPAQSIIDFRDDMVQDIFKFHKIASSLMADDVDKLLRRYSTQQLTNNTDLWKQWEDGYEDKSMKYIDNLTIAQNQDPQINKQMRENPQKVMEIYDYLQSLFPRTINHRMGLVPQLRRAYEYGYPDLDMLKTMSDIEKNLSRKGKRDDDDDDDDRKSEKKSSTQALALGQVAAPALAYLQYKNTRESPFTSEKEQKKEKRKNALIGALSGVGLGAGLYGINRIMDDDIKNPIRNQIGETIGGAAGGAAGFASGMGIHKAISPFVDQDGQKKMKKILDGLQEIAKDSKVPGLSSSQLENLKNLRIALHKQKRVLQTMTNVKKIVPQAIAGLAGGLLSRDIVKDFIK